MNLKEKLDLYLNDAININTTSKIYQNIGYIIDSSNIDDKTKNKALKLKRTFEKNKKISKSDEKWVFEIYRKLRNK